MPGEVWYVGRVWGEAIWGLIEEDSGRGLGG